MIREESHLPDILYCGQFKQSFQLTPKRVAKFLNKQATPMADIVNNPEFQILTHQQTGKQTGRVYFPAIWLAENHQKATDWMRLREIQFDEHDIKLYGDGSIRIYFRALNLKRAYKNIHRQHRAA